MYIRVQNQIIRKVITPKLTGANALIWNSRRVDTPYGTFASVATNFIGNGLGSNIGKIQNGGSMLRYRIGINFDLPAMVEVLNCTLRWTMRNNFSAGDTFTPDLYTSNTDDSAGTGTWYQNLNNFCGSGVYGGNVIQLITVPSVAIISRQNAVLSFILGGSVEIANGGTQATSGSLQSNAGATLAGSSVLTVDYRN